ncbi:lysozyme inhibitor LprI family protein [Clostridium perfringens]
MKMIMENKNGIRKEVKEGFSWTTLFFRWLPSLLRGDLVSALKLFIIGSLTFGIYTDYKSYNINEDYYTFLTEKGYYSNERFNLKHNIIGNLIVGLIIGIKVLLIIILIVLSFIFVTTGFNIMKDINVNNILSIEDNKNPIITSKNNEVNYSSIYKENVTTNDLNRYYNKYNSNLDQLIIEYGEGYKKYGLILDGEPEEAMFSAKDYFDYLDKVLNEEWSDLRIVLTNKEFDKLKNQQINWIKERDRIAKEESNSKENNSYRKVIYVIVQGKETEKRIRELNEKYLNPDSL